MLKVSIEIIPFGNDDHPDRRQIGTLNIGLQSVKGDNIGVYSSIMSTDGKCLAPRLAISIEHPRNEGAFELVKHAITEHLNLDEEDAGPACAACGGTSDLMGCEYDYSHPDHYDGVSEWRCPCGTRTGRWTGRVLEGSDTEKVFGRP